MNKLIVVCLLFCFNLYAQTETQSYIYKTKSLTLEVNSNAYSVTQIDTILVSINFINNSDNTILIDTYKSLKIVPDNRFTIYLSNPSSANIDYTDSLLMLYSKTNLKYIFKIPLSDWKTKKSEYIFSSLYFSYISSIDLVRKKYNISNENIQRNKLFLPHSVIEACAELKEIAMFTYKRK